MSVRTKELENVACHDLANTINEHKILVSRRAKSLERQEMLCKEPASNLAHAINAESANHLVERERLDALAYAIKHL